MQGGVSTPSPRDAEQRICEQRKRGLFHSRLISGARRLTGHEWNNFHLTFQGLCEGRQPKLFIMRCTPLSRQFEANFKVVS
jgi:hypothetical protein